MEEFTSIAVWLLIIFLIVNATIFWFGQQQVIIDAGLTPGLNENNTFNQAFLDSTKTTFFGFSCNQLSSNILLYGPCFLQQVLDLFTKFLDAIWNFLTAWVSILNLVFSFPGGELFRGLLIPFFGVIEFMAIFVVGLRIAGIIRGGS